MPSRPSLPPPQAPKGAKQIEIKKLSQSTLGFSQTKHHSKKWLIAVFVIVIGILMGIAILVAKTGVYQIPFLSSFYHVRPVTRSVDALPIRPQVLLDRATSLLQSTTSSNGGDVVVAFTEQEMTGALKGALQTSLKRPGVNVDQSQIVATPSGLEVTAFVRNETMSVHLFTKVIPIVQNGRLVLDVKEVYLGDIPVPASSLGQIERIAFGSEIGSFEARSGKYGLKSVILKDGLVELKFSTSTTSNQ